MTQIVFGILSSLFEFRFEVSHSFGMFWAQGVQQYTW
jgi:hypothetical protein